MIQKYWIFCFQQKHNFYMGAMTQRYVIIYVHLHFSHKIIRDTLCSLALCTKSMFEVKEHEYFTHLNPRHLLPKTRGRIYNTCVHSALLHASETWPLTKQSLLHLQRNDRAMIKQLCHVNQMKCPKCVLVICWRRLGCKTLT